MHCNLTIYLFVSSSFCSWKQWWNSLITSENQIVCFPSFVLTVFCYSTSYTVIVVLWKMLLEPVNALARWWPCACLKCVCGLWRLEKTLNFLRCIHVLDLLLKYPSDINEGNWLQLFFYFIVLMGIVASVIGMSFFSCGSGFILKFSRIALWRKRLQLDSKSDLTTNGLILGFFLEKSFFRWLHICINWNLQELLIYFSILTTSNFFNF